MRRFTPARLLAMVAALGLCGAGLLTQLQTRTTLYRTPFAAALPWGAGGEPLSERVVFCLVDGLREDTSRTMAPLNALRKRGADWTLTASPPTFSIPLSHVIVTGAPQLTIGMLTNNGARLVGPGFYRTFGTLYTAAQQAGLRAGNVVTWPSPYPLEDILDAPNTLPGAPGAADDDGLVPRVLEVLAAPDAPQFLWVHFDIVDRAGHAAGAASADYRDAAARTGERIGQIAAAMDWSRETLIVSADHGHLDRGGHGGSEPEVVTVPCVLVGAGIQPGTRGAGRQIDLASTVAWLLGTPIPTHNQGWPIVEALDVPAQLRAQRGRDTVVQRLQAYRFRLDRLGLVDQKLDAPLPHRLGTEFVDAMLTDRVWDQAWAGAANLASELHIRWKGWMTKTAVDRLRPRLYASVGFGLLAVVVSGVMRRRRVAAGGAPAGNPPLWLLAGIVAGAAVPTLVYLGGGNHYSLSGLGRAGVGAFALPRMVEGALGLAAAYTVARVLATRSAPASAPAGSVLAAMAGSLGGVAVAGAAIYLLGFGLDPQPWHKPGAAPAVLLVGTLQFMGVAGVSGVAALVLAVRGGGAAEHSTDA